MPCTSPTTVSALLAPLACGDGRDSNLRDAAAASGTPRSAVAANREQQHRFTNQRMRLCMCAWLIAYHGLPAVDVRSFAPRGLPTCLQHLSQMLNSSLASRMLCNSTFNAACTFYSTDASLGCPVPYVERTPAVGWIRPSGTPLLLRGSGPAGRLATNSCHTSSQDSQVANHQLQLA